MAFALDSCPSGWSEYTQAQGRFVIGADPGNGAFAVNNQAVVTGTVGANPTIDINQGHTEEANAVAVMPRYVALLYCRKDP